MNVHFIAIGGSIMHNLALALRKEGHNVSGSDDEIFDPAKTNLSKAGLLPNEFGWFAEKVTSNLDAVIVGMHAKKDNPELLKAKELGIPTYSFPAFAYERLKEKKRVVIGGSHGKTTITSMIMHVLKHYNKAFDYLVGSQLKGFDLMVQFSDDALFGIIEGDEYLSSPLEPIPKFHLYKPHLALVSGIAWDHINVFPTFENYVEQFKIFLDTIEPGGTLIYNTEDANLRQLADQLSNVHKIPYQTSAFAIENGQTIVKNGDTPVPLNVFGRHNLQNLEGARNICNQLGIGNDDFYAAIQSFTGAAKRMEVMTENDVAILYKDFAHAPSKVNAAVKAVKEQFPNRALTACLELHTYSSLNSEFVQQYKGALDAADNPVVFYSQHALEIKKLPPIEETTIKAAFDNENLRVINQPEELAEYLHSQQWNDHNLLMMSSGNFGGLSWRALKGLF